MMKASEFQGCTFKVKTPRGGSDLSSILSLISLGLQYGDEAVINVDGPNAAKACEAVAIAFETEYDFPPK
jgi:phosphotransferase system HPr-like phosphotransfer protein